MRQISAPIVIELHGTKGTKGYSKLHPASAGGGHGPTKKKSAKKGPQWGKNGRATKKQYLKMWKQSSKALMNKLKNKHRHKKKTRVQEWFDEWGG